MAVRSSRPQDLFNPGTRRVDERAGLNRALLARVGCHVNEPLRIFAACRGYCPTRLDMRATLLGVESVHDYQAGVVGPTVGIFEAQLIAIGERAEYGIATATHGPCRWQSLAASDVVVKKQSQPQQPWRSQAAVYREDEPQRADDVGRRRKQHLTLGQTLMH